MLRLFLQDRLDPSFDAKSVIKKYARFAETIHLSNVQLSKDNTILNARYPVLPNQDSDDGWAPIQDYLSLIVQENNKVKIMFEHRSDLVSDEELQECYDWVGSFFLKKHN